MEDTSDDDSEIKMVSYLEAKSVPSLIYCTLGSRSNQTRSTDHTQAFANVKSKHHLDLFPFFYYPLQDDINTQEDLFKWKS